MPKQLQTGAFWQKAPVALRACWFSRRLLALRMPPQLGPRQGPSSLMAFVSSRCISFLQECKLLIALQWLGWLRCFPMSCDLSEPASPRGLRMWWERLGTSVSGSRGSLSSKLLFAIGMSRKLFWRLQETWASALWQSAQRCSANHTWMNGEYI